MRLARKRKTNGNRHAQGVGFPQRLQLNLTNNPTRGTSLFNIFIYFSSLDVSGIQVTNHQEKITVSM